MGEGGGEEAAAGSPELKKPVTPTEASTEFNVLYPYQYQRTIQNPPASLARQAEGGVGVHGWCRKPGLSSQKRREERVLHIVEEK